MGAKESGDLIVERREEVQAAVRLNETSDFQHERSLFVSCFQLTVNVGFLKYDLGRSLILKMCFSYCNHDDKPALIIAK